MGNSRIEEFNEVYNDTYRVWSAWLKEAETDLKFYLGDQWTATEKGYLKDKNRYILVFNKIHRVVKFLTGYQRKNRLSMKIAPVEGSDEETASQLSGVIQYVMQFMDGYNIMSEGFEQGPIKTGLGLIDPYLDFTDDRVNGDIKLYRIPFNRFLLDPSFTRRDLDDCGYILRREWIQKDAGKSIFPDRAKDIDSLQPSMYDNKFERTSYSSNMFEKNMVRYDEHWKRTYEPVKIIVDMSTGQSKKWEGDRDGLRELLNEFRNLRVFKTFEKSVSVTVFIEDEEMYHGPEPFGLNDYRFVPLIGFYDSEYIDMALKLQGVVRCMRDPQREGNKRKSKMLDILDSQINSGWQAEENTVVDKESLYNTGQGGVVWMKEGKMESAEKLPAADIPQGQFQLSEKMDQEVVDIPGANSELLGADTDKDIEVAGILAKLRQGQGLTIMQDLFDNYNSSEKLLGKKLIKLIQNNFSAEKIKRITNREPTREFYSRDFGKYDAIPTQGVLTDTQRQMHLAELVALKKVGVKIPDAAIIDASNLERKDLLKKVVDLAQQQAAQGNKINMAQIMATIESQKAKAAKDIATIKEKESKVVENLASAQLDKILAAKEAADIGPKQLERAVKITKDLEEIENPKVRRKALTRR